MMLLLVLLVPLVGSVLCDVGSHDEFINIQQIRDNAQIILTNVLH